MAASRDMSRPLVTLGTVFVGWKLLIWLIAYSSPGIGYDTSSDLLAYSGHGLTGFQDVPSSISSNVLKLVRWDAIYYTETARRGHIFEQQWAFGKGVSTVLAFIVNSFGSATNHENPDYAFVGALVSFISHGLAVLLVFLLALSLQDATRPDRSSIAFNAAVLHILSPAGIFLSAPCSESLFSFLNILGYYCYVKSISSADAGITGSRLMMKICSGIALGCATVVRSNGVLSGIPFLIDAIESVISLVSPSVDNFGKVNLLLQLQFTVLAGCCVALGMILPQFLAYKEYCMEGPSERPWCNALLPSIFSFVQSHYWNVGFLRYWTLSNIPLFLLAVPCLYVTIWSGWREVRSGLSPKSTLLQKLRLRIALPQLVLSVLALTNYHVQIITRICSGYPLWYMWLATRIRDWKYSEVFVRTIVIYGLVQAGLFASFLPPA